MCQSRLLLFSLGVGVVNIACHERPESLLARNTFAQRGSLLAKPSLNSRICKTRIYSSFSTLCPLLHESRGLRLLPRPPAKVPSSAHGSSLMPINSAPRVWMTGSAGTPSSDSSASRVERNKRYKPHEEFDLHLNQLKQKYLQARRMHLGCQHICHRLKKHCFSSSSLHAQRALG